MTPVVAEPTARQVTLRSPTVADAAAVHDLVRRSGRLDVNTRYAYLIWCRDFASTSLVAEHDGAILGFVTGYRPPRDPAVYFAWQSAVDQDRPIPGLAFAMMDEITRRVRAQGARIFETTVNPGNRAIIMLLRKLVAEYDGELEISELFGTGELGAGHEVEMLYRFSIENARQE
ncbi:diaminobutyrate acetyltransferase [Amycolatopsis sp. WAC 04182]|uniref:diaminobutyrate acetyltransferase n=1 Tax=Amycolatopsis sp. WAC 04182 TaxID=2203198 RepID=UPI000F787540|nr:diaminobutyrate acetyltransferase [Amycolatopsis sp. WAC 04182]RSN54429.1 diaminobutyrate acetyltransferase [Amycolatopsis sp. WAC 04182]